MTRLPVLYLVEFAFRSAFALDKKLSYSNVVGVCYTACQHHARCGDSSGMQHQFADIFLLETESAGIDVRSLSDIVRNGMYAVIVYNYRCSIWIVSYRVIQKRIGNVQHYPETLVKREESES